jgi:pyruvate kinase
MSNLIWLKVTISNFGETIMTRTKIICTIGPSCNSLEKIKELIQAGMNVARLNFSHGTYDEYREVIGYLKEARSQLGVSLAIMLDTKGPEIRIGKIANHTVQLAKGDKWQLMKEPILGDKEKISITPAYILDDLPLNNTVLFDNGYISSHIIEKTAMGVTVEIENGGIISSGKGVNIPTLSLNLPAVTEKDISDIRFGCEEGIDIIAASFARSADNIITIKNLLTELKSESVLVIAKIENHEGIENFDAILQVADGVMIARGDLGVEIPLSKVPKLQKDMIRKCYLAGKPSVTATQMLESMILNPRPTRAEVSDVANAIYDSTSAVMLSGETAVGKYPIETVKMMKSIIEEAEADFNYRNFFDLHSRLVFHDVPSAVTLATVKTAYSSNATAILAFTQGGATARLLSRLRPQMPIIAMTPSLKVYNLLSINWGVIPFHGTETRDFREALGKISDFALEKKILSYGDLVVVIAGATFGVSGTTNMMIVENIGDVLVRGFVGIGPRVHGNVVILLSTEGIKPYSVRGDIIVIPKYDSSLLPLVEEAAGVILQNHIDDEASEKSLLEVGKELNKPIIVRADTAASILKEGQLITIDPEKALVYKGVVL